MAKHWCFTINNPKEEHVKIKENDLEYMIIGQEKCPKTGTPHLQGYVIMKRKRELTAMKKLFPTAHLETKQGTVQQAADYCKKEGYWSEIGKILAEQWVKGGEKTAENYIQAWDLAKQGRIEEIEPIIRIKHFTSLNKIHQHYQVKPDDLDKVCGRWYYGPPNTGKSTTARERYPGYYDKCCNKWWDGYQGEENIIIDDFDLNHKVLGHHIKRWTDKFSFGAEHKGTTFQIRPKKIIITSNYRIEEIWQDDQVLVKAIQRRCKEVPFTVNPFNKK